MKINRLTIQNFRNHINTTVELDWLNIFVGSNNSGKSSILAAVEWALTGRNMWTDRAGRGAGDLVTRGAEGCQVALELASLGGVVRSMPPHTLAAGRHQGVQEAQAAICHHLGADEKLLQLVLNNGAFTGLAPADQKAFLFGLSGVSFGCDQITDAALACLLKSGVREDLAQEAAGRVKTFYPGGITGSPGVLEVMGKKAREKRKDVKKDLERTRAALAEMAPPELPQGIGLEDRDEVVGQIKELEVELNHLLQALGARQAAGRACAGLQVVIGALEGEIAALARTREAKAAALKEADGEEVDQKANRAWKRMEQAEQQLGELNQEAARIEGGIKSRQQVRDKLQGFNGRCPLAPEHVSCAMSAAEVKDLAARLAGEMAAEYQKAGDVGEKIQELKGEVSRSLANFNRLQSEQVKLDRLERELTGLHDVARRREGDLAGFKEELAELEEAARAPVANPEELDLLQGRIAKGRELLRQLEVAGHVRQHTTRLQDDLADLQREVDSLEHLVQVLGPDGVKQTLLGDRLAGFTNQLNDNLAAFTGGRYQLAWGEDYTPVIRHSGHALPVRLLSKSEQFRVGVAFQAAIAKTAGLKFLAVDDMEILDQGNLDLLTGYLQTLVEFEQILLFCTMGDTEPRNPGLPGVSMFRVKAGAVSAIKGGEGSD